MYTLIRLACISLFISAFLSKAQNFDSLDCGFFKHLHKNKLYSERLLYLNQLTDPSLKLRIQLDSAWTLYQLQDYSRSMKVFKYCDSDTLKLYGYLPWRLSSALHSLDRKETKQYFSTIVPTDSATNTLLKMCLLKHPETIDFNSFSIDIQKKYQQYHYIEQKNMALAMGLATAVPGLGKYYLGKKADAITSLLAVGIFGIQFTESYVKSGWQNWRTILFGGLTFSFYSSNIYGTYKSLIKTRKEKRKEFIKTLNEDYLDHMEPMLMCR